MRKGYESKQSYQEGRQLRKAQWRKLALGVALMTGCWQLGWMPMAEAADVVKKEITQAVLNSEDTIKDYTQEATNLTTTDGGVFAAATGAGGVNGPGGGKTITLTNNTVHLTGATINDTRRWHEPNVIAVRVTLGNNQFGSQNESYVLSGNAIKLDGTIKTTGNAGGRLEGAWIICNSDYKATTINATGNSVTINADTDSSSIGSGQIAGAEIGTANTSLAEGNKVKITGGNFTNGNLIIAGALPSDRAGNSTSLRAIGNTVEISGGQFVAGIKIVGAIERGTNYFNEASQNVVTIRGGTFDANTTIIGGKGTTAKGNIVNINAAIKVKSITGGDGTTSKDNTLNLGKAGIEVTDAVSKAQTIAITNGVTFTDGATVLKAGSISNMETLDITGTNFTGSGTMKLLASDAANNFSSVNLKYGSGTTATLNSSKTSQKVKDGTGTQTDTKDNGVKLTYAEGAHFVKLDTANSYKNVLYTTANVLSSVDISGWTGGETAVPDGWEPDEGISVTGTGFTPPTLDPGNSTNILTSNTNGFFDNANIDDDIKYKASDYSETEGTITLAGSQSKGVKANGKNLVYSVGMRDITSIALGETTYNKGAEGLDRSGNAYNYEGLTLDTSNFKLNMTADQAAAAQSGDSMTLVKGNDTLTDNAGQSVSTAINYTASNSTKLTADVNGTVAAKDHNVNYTVNNIVLNTVDIGGWDYTESAVPASWAKKEGGVSVIGTNFTAPTMDLDSSKTILTTNTDGYFTDATIADELQYKSRAYSETAGTINLSGTQYKGVKADADGKNLVYSAGKAEINTIELGDTTYDKGTTWQDRSSAGYDYSGVQEINTTNFKLSMTDEQATAARNGDSMTLLAANTTLNKIAQQVAGSAIKYTATPVEGVTETGTITGSVGASGGNVTYTVTDKRASNLTFGAVNWTGSDALVTRPDGVSYADATVDATNISFSGVKNLTVGDAMTLIGAYDGDTLNAQGEKFTAGMSVVGTGKMSLDDDGNVIYTVSSVSGSEQSHNTLMGAAASIAALSMGNEFIDSAMEGLALPENIGKDGISCYAKIGGGKLRQQTGSHVNVNTWNAILALGHKNEQKKSTTEYGAFFEYGRGNYTTHNDNVQNGDGKAHYTGGGLLGKWASKDGLYVEGSFRAGNVREDAQNLLRDDNRAYSYNTSATYYGFHLGVGKQLAVAKDSVVDVYGKYFYNHKNGVDFTVNGDQYKIDALTSQVARLGVRYTLKRDKWNFYGDLAYEHELDGKAKGRVNGATIRGTDTSGGSARLELGATLLPTEKSPWSLDLNATGFAGKKRGISGGVSLKYLF